MTGKRATISVDARSTMPNSTSRARDDTHETHGTNGTNAPSRGQMFIRARLDGDDVYGRTRVVAARGGREEDARGEEEGERGERVDEDSLAMRVAMGLLDFYKREISPALPKSCRFVPTCSEYARQAYKKYGTKKGFVLTAWRIMRCNPLGGKGYDPPMWPPVYLGSDPVRLDDER